MSWSSLLGSAIHLSFIQNSSRQRLQKLVRFHAIFERLAPIDPNHWNLIVILLPQFRVEIDIHLAPFKFGSTLELYQNLFDDVTEMASLTRIHQYLMHRAIVTTSLERVKLQRRDLIVVVPALLFWVTRNEKN